MTPTWQQMIAAIALAALTGVAMGEIASYIHGLW